MTTYLLAADAGLSPEAALVKWLILGLLVFFIGYWLWRIAGAAGASVRKAPSAIASADYAVFERKLWVIPWLALCFPLCYARLPSFPDVRWYCSWGAIAGAAGAGIFGAVVALRSSSAEDKVLRILSLAACCLIGDWLLVWVYSLLPIRLMDVAIVPRAAIAIVAVALWLLNGAALYKKAPASDLKFSKEWIMRAFGVLALIPTLLLLYSGWNHGFRGDTVIGLVVVLAIVAVLGGIWKHVYLLRVAIAGGMILLIYLGYLMIEDFTPMWLLAFVATGLILMWLTRR